MSKYTPGPYQFATVRNIDFREPDSEDFMIVDAEMTCVGIVWGCAWKHGEPNARLLAAAPELLAVAERSASALRSAGIEPNAHSDNPLEWLLHETEAAIAKARGDA